MRRARFCLAVSIAVLVAPSLSLAQDKNSGPVIPGGSASRAAVDREVVVVMSTDVPHSMPDENPVGITSTLQGPMIPDLEDVNLIFSSLPHTCIPDLHIELTSPSGTNVPVIHAYTEDGILQGFGCPENFLGTIIDDEAVTNLQDGTAPWTGSFNVNHLSVGDNPLSGFVNEDAEGTWTLFVSDLGGGDTGVVEGWGLEFSGDLQQQAGRIPSLNGWGVGLLIVLLAGSGAIMVRFARR